MKCSFMPNQLTFSEALGSCLTHSVLVRNTFHFDFRIEGRQNYKAVIHPSSSWSKGGLSRSFFHPSFWLRHSASLSPSLSSSVRIICSFGQALGANLQFGCCNMFWLFRLWFGLIDIHELAKRRLSSPGSMRGCEGPFSGLTVASSRLLSDNSPDASRGIPQVTFQKEHIFHPGALGTSRGEYQEARTTLEDTD